MTRAAVMTATNAPIEVHSITVDAPRAREVRVRLAASGVCLSDIKTWQTNDANVPMPIVLGHEGSGVVEEVGDDVTHVAPGDHVILVPMPACGECYFCSRQLWTLCEKHALVPTGGLFDGTPRLGFADGSPLYQLTCAGTFTEATVAPASSVVKIDPEMPLVQAALIGCGVVTGFGAAANVAQIRPGDTVAVVGCGGVGLNAVQGARVAGAERIIAVDVQAWKLDLAKVVGATHTVDASADDPVAVAKELTGGYGVDVAFDVSGHIPAMQQAIDMTRPGGQCVFTGTPKGDVRLPLHPRALVTVGKTFKGNMLGMNDFHVEFPRLVELYRNGQLKLDELITKRITLDEVNDAFQATLAGEVARSVIVFD